MVRTFGRDLVHRWEENPIVTLEDIPFPASNIYNAGAIKIGDEYILLITVESLEGTYSIYPATSKDGYNFTVSRTPFISPASRGHFEIYEKLGTLDPRIVKLEDEYYVTYNAFGPHGYMVGIAKTKDFKTSEKLYIVSEVDTKAGVLFPRKIKGKYACLLRPWEGASIWVTYSDDLEFWGHSEAVMTPRGGFWDWHHIGAAAPLFEVKEGWMLIYYGLKQTSAGPVFRLGVAILDHEEPTRVIGRSNIPILSPRENYERVGDIPNVVFCCGAILESNEEVKLYYGAANSCICVGTVKISSLIESCFESKKEF